MSFRNLLRDCLPPLAKRRLQRLLQKYGWSGDYCTWQEAAAKCSSYAADDILARVRAATRAVQAGQARYERDSVLFYEPDYSWPLLATLMQVAALRNGRLHVLDFGGALGSTYYQNKSFFGGLDEVRWSVVEQENFVSAGQHEFQDNELRFYPTVNDAMGRGATDVLVLSSVLQYLPHPYEFLSEILACGISYVVIDRTGFADDDRDHITIQRVSPAIYNASYPCHFFGKARFTAILKERYEITAEFPALDNCAYPAEFRGFILRHKAVPGADGNH